MIRSFHYIRRNLNHQQMKPKQIRQYFFLAVIATFSMACQEDAGVETQTEILEDLNSIDQDMLDAAKLANAHLDNIGARTNSTHQSITVLRYINNQLKYNTNTDDIGTYQSIDEQTVTVYAEPGEFVFWYSGTGVDDLEGIEFDEVSQDQLNEAPEEVNANLMWVTQVPSDAVPGTVLKYDILYSYEEGSYVSPVIRLDPKVVIR